MAEEAAAGTYQIAARIERLPLSTWHLRVLSVIGMGWFFDAFDALAIAYVLPALIGQWHLDPAQIGALIAIGYAGQIIGSIFFGWLAERIGRVPCTIYTLLIFSIMSFACAFAWGFQPLMWMRFVQGLGLGGEIPIMATYIGEFARAERRGRFSLGYQYVFAIGLFVVGLAGVWIVPRYGWQWMFIIGAVPALLVLPLRRLLPESPRWLASRGRFVEADRVLRQIEDEISDHGARPLPPIPAGVPPVRPATTRFKDLLRGIYRKRSLTVWAIWFCSYIVIYGLTTWMPSIYRTVYHASLQQSLNYGFILSTAGLFSTGLAVLLIDWIGRKAMFAGGQLFSAVALLILAFDRDIGTGDVLYFVVAGYLGVSLLAVSLSTYTAELYPTEMRALGCGVGNAWLRFASVVGPYFIGAVLPVAGINAVYLVFGLFALLGGAITWAFAIETRGKILEKLSPSL